MHSRSKVAWRRGDPTWGMVVCASQSLPPFLPVVRRPPARPLRRVVSDSSPAAPHSLPTKPALSLRLLPPFTAAAMMGGCRPRPGPPSPPLCMPSARLACRRQPWLPTSCIRFPPRSLHPTLACCRRAVVAGTTSACPQSTSSIQRLHLPSNPHTLLAGRGVHDHGQCRHEGGARAPATVCLQQPDKPPRPAARCSGNRDAAGGCGGLNGVGGGGCRRVTAISRSRACRVPAIAADASTGDGGGGGARGWSQTSHSPAPIANSRSGGRAQAPHPTSPPPIPALLHSHTHQPRVGGVRVAGSEIASGRQFSRAVHRVDVAAGTARRRRVVAVDRGRGA